MVYTKEEIERYLEILKKYNRTSSEVGEANRYIKVWKVSVIVFLLIQVIKSVRSVVRVTAMFWGIMIRKIMIDYIFERRIFIRESIIMIKRLIKFLKDYT